MWVINLRTWLMVHVAWMIVVASSMQSMSISVDCDPPIKYGPLINHIWLMLCVSMLLPPILVFSLFSLVFYPSIMVFHHSEGSWHAIFLIFEWSLSKCWRLRECFGFIFGPFSNKANSPHNLLENASYTCIYSLTKETNANLEKTKLYNKNILTLIYTPWPFVTKFIPKMSLTPRKKS